MVFVLKMVDFALKMQGASAAAAKRTTDELWSRLSRCLTNPRRSVRLLVRFQHKNPDFPLKNPDFPLKNPDLPILMSY